MAYIKLVSDDEAEGALAELFDQARTRAGKVYNIVRTMSPNPPVLQASIGFYIHLMRGPSGLSRQERELLAVVVSRANDCFY